MSRMRALGLVLAVIVAFPVLRATPAHSWHGSGNITALAIDPQNPAIIYVGTYDRGVFKSIDGGASWIAAGLSNMWVTALAIDPQTPGTVYAGTALRNGDTQGGGVFKSVNGGGDWSVINSGLTDLNVADLAVDPQTPAILYVVIPGTFANPGEAIPDAGVFKSTDGGATWSLILRNTWFWGTTMFLDLAIDPQNPAILYATVHYYTSEEALGEVLKSTDGGANWFCALCSDWWSGPVFQPMGDLATAPQTSQNPTTVFAASSHDPTLFKSTDGGARWIELMVTQYAAQVNDLAVDPQNPATLYAVISYSDVFKSVDGGATWIAVNTGLTDTLHTIPRILAIDPQNPTTLYLGTDVGVFKSTDGAGYWSPTGLIQHSPLSSVSLNPTSVVGGTASTGTVTLITAAQVGGVTVTLSSSNTAAAVPASVTVPAGATSATFTVSTSSVTWYTGVMISASFDDLTKSTQLLVKPAVILSSVSLNPSSVPAGSPSTGTVTLSAAAPESGAVVGLRSSNSAVANVPASVTVPAGAASATFTVATSPVTASTSVVISGTYNEITSGAWLTVMPAATLSSVSLNPTSVAAGSTSTGTVTLNMAAPTGGAMVALSSNDTAVATVPTSVTVVAGATSANFTVLSGSVSACSSAVTISGTYAGVTKSAVLTVTPTVTDTVTIQMADYFSNKQELRVAAKGTNSSATLRVDVTLTEEMIGQLTNGGDGTFRGQFKWPGNPMNITVRSSLCGSATSAVRSK